MPVPRSAFLRASRQLLRQRQRGAFAVEFAITVGLFLLLVFAIANLGLAAWNYNTMSHASREGVRYGSVLSNSEGRYSREQASALIRARVQVHAVGQRFDAIDISWEGGDNAPGKVVTVTTRYRFYPVTPLFGKLGISLRSSASMMISN